VILVLLLLAVVFIGVPLLANTEKGRAELSKTLSKALHRDVSIGKLDVGFFFSSVEVGALKIKNPEGFAGDFLNAEELKFDAKLQQLVNGRVVGGLSGRGLDVKIIRKDGKTNLEGFGGSGGAEKDGGGSKKPDEPGEPAPEPKREGGGAKLDLSLMLHDARLTVEDLDKKDTLVLEGVSLEMRLTNEAGAPDTGLKIRVRSIANETITVRDLEIDAKQAGDFLDLQRLHALLPGDGTLEGTGRMRVRGGDEWNVTLDAENVGIEDNMMPLVASMFPFAAKAGDGQVNGRIGANFVVKGNGLTWEAMKPSLDGTGEVRMTGLTLPSGSLLFEAAKWAGRADGGALDLHDAGAAFAIQDGWLAFNRLSASGKEARYDLAGRVSLEGKLDLTMDLAPLIDQFGGKDLDPKVRKYLAAAPMRIQGTAASPQYRLPKLEDLVKEAAKGALEEKIGGILDGIGKKKKD
jgi:hypothetical protein